MNFKTTFFGLNVEIECTLYPGEPRTHVDPGTEPECELDSIEHKGEFVEIDSLPEEELRRFEREAFQAAADEANEY